MKTNGKKQSQKVLLFCIFSSVFVHLIALGFLLYRFSFLASNHGVVVIEKELPDTKLLDPKEIVEMVFEAPPAEAAITFYSPENVSYHEDVLVTFFSPEKELLSENQALPTQKTNLSLKGPKATPTLLQPQNIVKSNPTFSFETHADWIEKWKEASLVSSDDSKEILPTLKVHPQKIALSSATFSSEKEFVPQEEKWGRRPTFFLGDLAMQKELFIRKEKQKRKPDTFLPHPLFQAPITPPIPSLKDLKTVSCAEDFSYDLVFCPSEEKDGYIFALTLLPTPCEKFKKMRQNFFFVIDTSNPITEKRLRSACNAVSSALSLLDGDDAFNILTFDYDLHYLFSGSSLPDKESKKLARHFLSDTHLGSFFSQSNYERPFVQISSYPQKKDEIHSIILLTSGQGLDKKKNYGFMKEWTRWNSGGFSLYTISLDSDPSLGLLDFFSSVNRGKLFTAVNDRGFRRQIQKVIHSIQYPIAKQVQATIYPMKNSHISLSFPGGLKPHIFSDSPYVIIGKTSSLEDFDLFLQGQNGEGYFNIKKRISFSSAKEGTRSLLREWTLHKSYPMYQQFLTEQDTQNLEEVKKLLAPYFLQTAF